MRKNKVTSAAAILSLALAIGACTSAFRLIDALLLRPLPIAHPERLYKLGRTLVTYDGWSHEELTELRQAADLIAISNAEQVDLTFGSDDEMEKGHAQYVSGGMYSAFGLIPAVGRLASPSDDAQPVAVLSYDYWSRRFARDADVVGHPLRIGENIYQIIGVAREGFSGTEPGTVIDIFLPERLHWGVGHDWAVFRVFTMQPEAKGRLNAVLHARHEHRPETAHQDLLLEPAAAGVSGLQKNYRLALTALGVLVALVLLIACANVANLMTAQTAARAREMAVRISLGASRWRIARLVLGESAWIAGLASLGGMAFAWWAGPFVVRMISTADNPVRLALPADWRVLGFALALTIGVTFLFGMGPALRASAVRPASALKGGEDPHSRRRWMRALIALHAAFCFLVLFVAGLFAMTFERLAHQPTGISADRILTLYTVSRKSQPVAYWEQAVDHLRSVSGVEKAALADWPILDGWGYRSSSIAADGAAKEDGGWFLNISPGLLEAMSMPILAGRDFSEIDTRAAIVNQAFVARYFHGGNAVGRWFAGSPTNSGPQRFQVVGVVRDARYRYLREPFVPVAYIPFARVNPKGEAQTLDRGTFIVRTQSEDPLAMASLLRQEIAKARPEFRVSNIRT
jgi:predicted permease